MLACVLDHLRWMLACVLDHLLRMDVNCVFDHSIFFVFVSVDCFVRPLPFCLVGRDSLEGSPSHHLPMNHVFVKESTVQSVVDALRGVFDGYGQPGRCIQRCTC